MFRVSFSERHGMGDEDSWIEVEEKVIVILRRSDQVTAIDLISALGPIKCFK